MTDIPSELEPLLFEPADIEESEDKLWKPHKGQYIASQVRDKDGVITRRTAYISCAACGAWSSLWEFDISDSDGLVDPPVMCPRCHVQFRPLLKGWGDIDWSQSQWTKPQELLSDGKGTL